MATKNSKLYFSLYIALIIIGCVLACSSLISNNYLKLFLVMASLCVGIYGIMKGLSSQATEE